MKRWVYHEGHEAHEGYDLGGFEARLKNNLPVRQLRALRALRGEIEFFLASRGHPESLREPQKLSAPILGKLDAL
jgi:hypothetical protein